MRALRSSIVAVVLGALIAPTMATPASGAEDDIIIPAFSIPLITQTTDPSVIQVFEGGAIEITVPEGERVQPQCVRNLDDFAGTVSGSITTCIGAPSPRDPLEDTGTGGLSDFLLSEDGDHVAALAWIMREAVDAIEQLYDLPSDGRVERYAGDEIRAYILSRVLDIFDRSLYGVELTPDEQITYDYFTEIFLSADRAVAQYAKEEFDRYMNNECGYRPPVAPSFVTDPVPLPQAVVDWCSRPRTQTEALFVFAPPIPSAEAFQAWGVYRNADALGLNSLTNGTVQQDLVDAQNAAYNFTALGAVAGATLGAGIAGSLVGASSVASGAVAGVIAPFAGVATYVPATAASASSIISGSVGATAAATVAAASIAAVVIVAIIVTAVAIVQLVAYEEVGRTINSRLANALSSRDPFGLDARRDQYRELGLRENFPLDDLVAYRAPNAVARILATIVDKTSARYGGVYVADQTSLWADNETMSDDFSFIVTDSSGSRPATSITVPLEDGQTTVRFSDGWIISGGPAGERATLSFPFVTPDGTIALASRNTFSDSGFTVITIDEEGVPDSRNVDTLEYRGADGSTVAVTLVPGSSSQLAGPTPSAVGPLTPGRTVILRPNPVDINGNFDLDRFSTGYEYSWTIVRHDSTAGAWTEVARSDGYDARVVPQSVGNYRASVRMRDIDDSDGTDVDVWGSVDFAIVAPPIQIARMELADDGIDALRLTTQLTADVPSNDFTISVTWPGSVDGGAPVTRSLSLPCIQLDALSCSTVNTAQFPEFNEVLSYTLPHDAALAQGVTVSVTDRFGGGTTQRFAIDNPSRPTIAPPITAPVAPQPGVVDFSPAMTTLQVPVGYATDSNYEVARLSPGTGESGNGFGLVDPASNAPVTGIELPGGGAQARIVYDADLDQSAVVVRVTATLAEVGTRVVPLVVQQSNGARSTLPLTLELVPATGDRFRGAIATSVDPLNLGVPAVPEIVPYVIGGKAEWEEYSSDVCTTVRFTEFIVPPVERCVAATELSDESGQYTPLDFREFFPEGLRAGRYEVSVSVVAGERTDATPITSVFRMLYGPPRVTSITYDSETASVTVLAEPSNAAVPIVSIECRLDGTVVDCADAASGTWPEGTLLPGSRTFTVDLVDEGGNYSSATQQFTVADPTDPTDPGEPTDPVTPTDPSNPLDPTEPTNPGDPVDPSDPTVPEVPIVIDPEAPEEPTVTLSTRRPVAGGTLVVEGSGFDTSATVRIELQSEPVVLANVRADSSGDFRSIVTVPQSTPPGPHDVVIIDTATGAEKRIAITVLPAPGLASTGAGDVGGALALALLILLFGVGFSAVRRRTLRP